MSSADIISNSMRLGYENGYTLRQEKTQELYELLKDVKLNSRLDE